MHACQHAPMGSLKYADPSGMRRIATNVLSHSRRSLNPQPFHAKSIAPANQGKGLKRWKNRLLSRSFETWTAMSRSFICVSVLLHLCPRARTITICTHTCSTLACMPGCLHNVCTCVCTHRFLQNARKLAAGSIKRWRIQNLSKGWNCWSYHSERLRQARVGANKSVNFQPVSVLVSFCVLVSV